MKWSEGFAVRARKPVVHTPWGQINKKTSFIQSKTAGEDGLNAVAFMAFFLYNSGTQVKEKRVTRMTPVARNAAGFFHWS